MTDTIIISASYHLDITKKLNSGAIVVKYINESKGRGTFAQRKFKSGEMLFEEAPIVSHRLYETISSLQVRSAQYQLLSHG